MLGFLTVMASRSEASILIHLTDLYDTDFLVSMLPCTSALACARGKPSLRVVQQWRILIASQRMHLADVIRLHDSGECFPETLFALQLFLPMQGISPTQRQSPVSDIEDGLFVVRIAYGHVGLLGYTE